jgi:hypothetical protein
MTDIEIDEISQEVKSFTFSLFDQINKFVNDNPKIQTQVEKNYALRMIVCNIPINYVLSSCNGGIDKSSKITEVLGSLIEDIGCGVFHGVNEINERTIN